STLGQALDIAEQFEPETVGVVVDTFHVWWDPDVWRQIERAGSRIASFQVCDWITPLPADVLLARGMPGDGHIDFPPFRAAAAADGPGTLADWAVEGPLPDGARLLAPVESQPVWAAGVTFARSRSARAEESALPDVYDRVYTAQRPELFFKAAPGTVRGPGEAVTIREDSDWDVPEPEVGLVLDALGRIVAYVVGDDMSSRSIEGDNPLYLPHAKVYDGSCPLGPALVPVE